MTDGAPARGTARIAANPFYLLELSPHCSAVEIERQGSKLLAMLELGLVEAETYDTPFGVRTRSEDSVRLAMAELRDPDRRLLHELWAAMDPSGPIEHIASSEADFGDVGEGPSTPHDAGTGFAGAMALLGWRSLDATGEKR